jgi:hypothetical protein
MRKYMDAEAALIAVWADGMALRDVSDALKTEAVCLAAVRQWGPALAFVPKAMKTPNVCLETVRQDGRRCDGCRQHGRRRQSASRPSGRPAGR